uniref:Cytochrome b5 heme-binding domain-containing protein n=1 Tax=Arion vulgaris TaxID=1028688 RepID=A0A0B7AZJ8_9EUPU
MKFLPQLVVLSLTVTFLYTVAAEDQHSNYVLKEVEVRGDKPSKIFTSAELGRFDGSNERLPIFMGIKGVVFDVSSGKQFYGKGASYNVLVGKDSTKAVAKMSLEPKDLTSDISDLSGSQLKSLDDIFESTYIAKYPVVGYMDYFVKKHPEKFPNAKLKPEL